MTSAMRRVRRADFLTRTEARHASEDRPLPIDADMTTSQPSLIARMIVSLELPIGAKVLEVGTGCGYQTALLAEQSADVYSVEIIGSLFESAAQRLDKLGYRNVHLRQGDGYLGWADVGPFDGIVVSASAASIPAPLVAQLKPNGHLVIPVGDQLLRVGADGSSTRLGGVKFVPLTGELAENDRLHLMVTPPGATATNPHDLPPSRE